MLARWRLRMSVLAGVGWGDGVKSFFASESPAHAGRFQAEGVSDPGKFPL